MLRVLAQRASSLPSRINVPAFAALTIPHRQFTTGNDKPGSAASRFEAFTRAASDSKSDLKTDSKPDQSAAAPKSSNTQRLLMDVISSIVRPGARGSAAASAAASGSSSQASMRSFPDANVYQPRAHIVHVKTSRNNTIASLTDFEGNAIVWASGGTVGMKKSHRGGQDVAYQAVMQLNEKAVKKGLDLLVDAEAGVELRLNGYGAGREMAFRAVRAMGWNIRRVSDVTPIRHAGCRPKRKRRL
ncbi:translational machinery component [Rhizoclosmatium globosum]|uniref:Translational machinery component n=1 Tax=Rhizoclosmatium globosum TaxID=329046 RepID=A0A1Y2CRE0_9FUNG|nr:hypothetical protein HDU79_001085 [Rhizoclosmatium sp. JEL0117]ORY49599.1 translational machinery component [Rhizoclosmatium globosum]|eukprot:ORY49599.1 translational machinery component [Rhizoclosmatium globosum]